MFRIGAPYIEFSQGKFGGLYTECDARDLPLGASPLCYDVDFTIAGVGPRPSVQDSGATFSGGVPVANFQWLKTCYLLGQITGTIAQDAGGNLWFENLASPLAFAFLYQSPFAVRALSATVGEREFICLSNLVTGLDQPRQLGGNGLSLDRISQVGPGLGPTVQSGAAITNAITSVSQPIGPIGFNSIAWGASINLYTAPAPANLLFFLSAVGVINFTTQIEIGDNVYVSGANTLAGFNPNGTYAVASIGTYTDQDGTRQYFGVVANSSVGDFARNTAGAGAQYQPTAAIVQISPPLAAENAVVGNTLDIAACPVTGWNGTWKITGTPTEGQLGISATSLASNLATYDYFVESGNSPGWQASTFLTIGSQIVDNNGTGHVWQITTPGLTGGSMPSFPAHPLGGSQVDDNNAVWTYQSGVTMPVTTFNTANGNGIFNVQNKTILSATATTFTIALSSPNIGAAAETGEAVSGSGSTLEIDPGLVTLGTGNPGADPIYTAATSGYVLSTLSTVAAGQRYAVLMFQTRNGYITPASNPLTFYTTSQSNQLTFSNLVTGPPDVIARIVAFTPANAGIGGPYFWIPEDVIVPGTAASLGQTTTINATIIPDNTSTSLVVTISDDVLTGSINITADGNNLLQQRELAECVKCLQYAGRTVYIGERNQVDNFANPTFDGGTNAAGGPAGWSLNNVSTLTIAVEASPIVNTSLLLTNTSGSTINPTGMTALVNMQALYQAAYQDGFLNPIIQPATAYSIRVTAAVPTGSAAGALVVELYSPGLATNWPLTVNLSSLTATIQEFTGALSNPLWNTVPTDLQLRVYPTGFTNTEEVLVDRIAVFPTNQPYLTTQAAVSYLENPEAIDGVTGFFDLSLYTSKPITDMYEFIGNQIELAVDNLTFRTSAVDGQEPSSWQIDEISNAVGELGPMCSGASDENAAAGEAYRVQASRNGLYLFDGGSHIKISQEIQQIWDAIYAPSYSTIWVLNDLAQQRFLVGVPLPTPNKWLPNAPSNPTPATPNVILMCSYLSLATGAMIAEALAVEPSMFTGHLLFKDGHRKWTIWQIPAAIGAHIIRPDNSEQIWFGQAPA